MGSGLNLRLRSWGLRRRLTNLVFCWEDILSVCSVVEDYDTVLLLWREGCI